MYLASEKEQVKGYTIDTISNGDFPIIKQGPITRSMSKKEKGKVQAYVQQAVSSCLQCLGDHMECKEAVLTSFDRGDEQGPKFINFSGLLIEDNVQTDVPTCLGLNPSV